MRVKCSLHLVRIVPYKLFVYPFDPHSSFVSFGWSQAVSIIVVMANWPMTVIFEGPDSINKKKICRMNSGIAACRDRRGNLQAYLQALQSSDARSWKGSQNREGLSQVSDTIKGGIPRYVK